MNDVIRFLVLLSSSCPANRAVLCKNVADYNDTSKRKEEIFIV